MNRSCCESAHIAAGAGHLDCLRFIIDHWDGFFMTWHPKTTWAAANSGRLDCLRFITEHWDGSFMTWHPETTSAAADREHLDCVKVIFEHCRDVAPWTDELDSMISTFMPEIARYLTSVREEWISHVSRQDNIKG